MNTRPTKLERDLRLVMQTLEMHPECVDDPEIRPKLLRLRRVIALALDLTVITGNVRHFDRIPGLVVHGFP